jgi:hypothetical protein
MFRHNDRSSAYSSDHMDYCNSLYQNYHELQQPPCPPSVSRRHHHTHRYESSVADSLPQYSASGHAHRAPPTVTDSAPGVSGGPCPCAHCYSAYNIDHSQYRHVTYGNSSVAPEQYDRLPGHHHIPHRTSTAVQQTPILAARRPRAVSPPGSRIVSTRTKTPFSAAPEDRRAPMTPVVHHKHQPSEVTYWPTAARDRYYDDSRRAAIYSSGAPRDGYQQPRR